MAILNPEIEELFNSARTDFLIRKADAVCRDTFGGKVFLRGLVEFSNYCTMDCRYCGIRHSNGNVHRYRLTVQEILDTVKQGFDSGLRTFVLQSGEDPEYKALDICRIAGKIKDATGGEAALTLSCGVFSKEDFRMIKISGADRYLLRFESADEALHAKLKNGIPLTERIEALRNLKELGFETGSGFMVGLPGETKETRLKNLKLSADLELDMAGIGPFIPHPETPLAGSHQENIELTIRMTALLRLTLPKSNIPATTAAGSLAPDGREKMLAAGANVLMPNITPVTVKKDYLLYPGKICLDESGLECISCLSLRVKSIGKELSYERGDSPRNF